MSPKPESTVKLKNNQFPNPVWIQRGGDDRSSINIKIITKNIYAYFLPAENNFEFKGFNLF